MSRPSPWWFALVYGLHILDEGLVAGGLPRWSTEQGFHFTVLNSVSGIALALPLAVWTLRWAWHAYPRRVVMRSALLGAAMFQAPWDMLVRLIFDLPFWTA